jgi:tRNA G18 (ribose-2'-O)-methylase SpoU
MTNQLFGFQIQALGGTVQLVTPQILKACCDTVTPQGILAIVDIPSVPHQSPKHPLYLVLDGVSDPGNVGTLIRSSLAVGVAGILLLPECCDVWNPKAVRSAMGASFQLPILEASSWNEAVEILNEWGVHDIYAATITINQDPSLLSLIICLVLLALEIDFCFQVMLKLLTTMLLLNFSRINASGPVPVLLRTQRRAVTAFACSFAASRGRRQCLLSPGNYYYNHGRDSISRRMSSADFNNVVSSTKSNTVKRVQALLNKRKKRLELGQTVVEGPRMVLDLLQNPKTRPLIRQVLVSTDDYSAPITTKKGRGTL